MLRRWMMKRDITAKSFDLADRIGPGHEWVCIRRFAGDNDMPKCRRIFTLAEPGDGAAGLPQSDLAKDELMVDPVLTRECGNHDVFAKCLLDQLHFFSAG